MCAPRRLRCKRRFLPAPWPSRRPQARLSTRTARRRSFVPERPRHRPCLSRSHTQRDRKSEPAPQRARDHAVSSVRDSRVSLHSVLMADASRTRQVGTPRWQQKAAEKKQMYASNKSSADMSHEERVMSVLNPRPETLHLGTYTTRNAKCEFCARNPKPWTLDPIPRGTRHVSPKPP